MVINLTIQNEKYLKKRLKQMKFLTRYRVSKAIKEIEPQKEGKTLRQRINSFWLMKIFAIFSPVLFLFKKFGDWLDKQHKGMTILIVLTALIFAMFVFNQLRYNYWVNIMHSNYPQEVRNIVDKVLIEWNARVDAGIFILAMLLVYVYLIIFNLIYNDDSVQVMPGTYKPK